MSTSVETGKAQASETATYCYDALGRLTQTGRVGGPATGKTTDTSYDDAGNRSNQTTASGTANCNDPTGAGGTGSSGGGSSGGGSSGGGDPDPTGPSFKVSDVTGTEGEVFVFTITKVGATTASHSVSYATAHGTTQTQDFTAVSGTLTFSPTQTSKTVSVTTTLDLKAESTEIFYLNLSNATGGATISDAQGKATMFNDDSVCALC